MATDWTHIYKKYKGLWVALKDDEVTVISAGKTLDEASEKAEKRGFKNPIFLQVPQRLTYEIVIYNNLYDRTPYCYNNNQLAKEN